MDAGQATIITDRCVPPSGLGTSPSTLKSVLWCLRGLGAPGSVLTVYASVIELRTCLSRRAVTKAIGVLKDCGILVLTVAPAPGQPSSYLLDYEKLAEWVSDEDLATARVRVERTRCHRSSAPDATDRAHEVPPSKPSCARHARSCAPDSSSCAPGATDIKEETAFLHTGSSSSAELRLAAAAEGIVRGAESWAAVAKRAGHERDLATQLGLIVERAGITDLERGRSLLERVAERVEGGGVRNPTGLLNALIREGDQVEPSRESMSRARARSSRRLKFLEFWNGQLSDEIRERVVGLLAGVLDRDLGQGAGAELIPGGQFAKPLGEWDAMVDFIESRWVDLGGTKPGVSGGAA